MSGKGASRSDDMLTRTLAWHPEEDAGMHMRCDPGRPQHLGKIRGSVVRGGLWHGPGLPVNLCASRPIVPPDREAAVALSWSREQVMALAPDAASAKAGQGLASARKWASLGLRGEILW